MNIWPPQDEPRMACLRLALKTKASKLSDELVAAQTYLDYLTETEGAGLMYLQMAVDGTRTAEVAVDIAKKYHAFCWAEGPFREFGGDRRRVGS